MRPREWATPTSGAKLSVPHGNQVFCGSLIKFSAVLYSCRCSGDGSDMTPISDLEIKCRLCENVVDWRQNHQVWLLCCSNGPVHGVDLCDLCYTEKNRLQEGDDFGVWLYHHLHLPEMKPMAKRFYCQRCDAAAELTRSTRCCSAGDAYTIDYGLCRDCDAFVQEKASMKQGPLEELLFHTIYHLDQDDVSIGSHDCHVDI